MADTLFGITKTNGFTATATDSLTSRSPEFIVVQTNIDIRLAADGSASSQAALDKLIAIVSQRGQPVLLGAIGAGTPSTYAVTFMNEHPNAWGCVEGVSGDQLVDRIIADGVNYGFPADNGGGHLIVTILADLNGVVQFFS